MPRLNVRESTMRPVTMDTSLDYKALMEKFEAEVDLFEDEPEIGANPIRTVGEEAAALDANTGVERVKANIGNPTAPQPRAVKDIIKKSVETRESGYDPHYGQPRQRSKVAKALNASEQVNVYDENNVAIVGGATVSTAALIIATTKKGGMVFVSDPGYPPYINQIKALGRTPVFYPVHEDGSADLDALEKILDEKLGGKKGRKAKAERFLVIYTEPHNPTGHANTAEEAERDGKKFSEIKEKYIGQIVYNDAVYNQTCVDGYNSICPHLSPEMQNHTITGISGAKSNAALGGERIGALGCPSTKVMNRVKGALSLLQAGPNTHTAEAYSQSLEQLAPNGTIQEFNASTLDNANYYNDRREVLSKALTEINEALETVGNQKIKFKNTKASMYLSPDFTEALKGKAVPSEMQEVVGSETFENGEHFRKFMMNLDKIGYPPTAMCNTELFREASIVAAIPVEQQTIKARLSTVATLDQMGLMAESFKGAFQAILGVDLGVEK